MIAIDQDLQAHKAAKETLKQHLQKVTFVHDNFVNIKSILQQLGIDKVDGILLDIGVSSYQLDESERGFSYQNNAALDMRMDNTNNFSAYDVVNTYSEQQLYQVIWKYGEERWAKRIAKFIVEQRIQKPIQTTFELVECIKKAIPKGARKEGPHPAKRTFQAIRIEVNKELEVLEKTIMSSIELLNVQGRFCIITFHSLEDRIVKNAFRLQQYPCICPKEFPVCVCGKKPMGKVITTKPILPSEEELEQNYRSRSAKLRVLEKI